MPITVKNSAGGGVTLDSSTSSNETINLNTPVFTGNVGIGVTPETGWKSNYSAVQIGGNGALYSNTAQAAGGSFNHSQNVYYDSSNEKYISTDTASKYGQYGGLHVFQVAPSGSADAAISWNTAMTIDNAGIATIPNQPALSIRRSGGQLVFNVGDSYFATTGVTKYTNKGGITHNTSNGRFTVPVAGTYHVGFHTMSEAGASGFYLMLNGAAFTQTYDSNASGSGQWNNQAATIIMTCAANDYISIICAQNGATKTAHADIHSALSIHLIG